MPESDVPEGAALFPLIPAELDIHPLLLAVLHATVFLAGSDDQVVDPEAATECMEYVATYLQRLGAKDLDRVRTDLECLLAFGKQEGWAKAELSFLKSFLADYGVGVEAAE